MYQCECGHTFTREKEIEHDGENYCVCPLCFNDRYSVMKDATYMMNKCDTLIAVWEDFYMNWSMIHCFTAKQRIDRHIKRLQRMRNYYLQQINQGL